MQIGRCPICHHRLSLDAIVQDAAASELTKFFAALDTDFSSVLISYLALFRSEKRDLANTKAVRLAQEVIALTDDQARLMAALNTTVDSLRNKEMRQLKNHNYLKRVLEDVPAVRAPSTAIVTAAPAGAKGNTTPQTKTGKALNSLEQMKR